MVESIDIDMAMETYIHVSKYARWIEKLTRREHWPETVSRYITFWLNRDTGISDELFEELENAILIKDVMPSMRSLMTAGKALEKDEIAGYNCSAIAVTHQAVFSEIFYILMCGAGAGFSVERQYINKMPEISEEMFPTETVIQVRDSKIGWATGLKELISMLYNGQVPNWDLSKVRPAGTRLKTFGGRASGPGPLDSLFKTVVSIFKGAVGRKLTSIECHDIICHIADSVIVGGVRRSALISLSNLTDDRMRRAKDGQWWILDPQRQLANNSVAYTEKPDLDSFSKEWRTLYKSKSGERGIWNKVAARKLAESRGRVYEGDYLTNPC
jgi:ribonucleoside-diphosphate reductase alpha chain